MTRCHTGILLRVLQSVLFFFETAETLTFYLDIILFENVPAQIADGVHLLLAAASLTFPNVDPARRDTRYKRAERTIF